MVARSEWDPKLLDKAETGNKTEDIIPATVSLAMAETIISHQISYDTAHVAQGKRATFFKASRYPQIDGSARVTELDEKSIVHWLMLCPQSRQLLLDGLGLSPKAFHQPEVVQPFYAPGQGDVDLIVCEPWLPSQAFALEFKRIKVEIVNAGEDKINKLQNLAEGVYQANKLHDRFGFFQTHLAIIIEVAASEEAKRALPMRGVRSDSTPQLGDTKRTTFRQIIEFPGRNELHSEVGIVFMEIVQPTRISIQKQATVRAWVYRRAESRCQLDSVTNRILEIMK